MAGLKLIAKLLAGLFVVERLVDGQWYYWGRYETLERAEEARAFLVTQYNLWARIVEA